jgi:uncharacterized glyoxalase superfamily protein PhnB
MSDHYKTYRPDGFHTVNPYLFASEPEVLIDFLKRAFRARETHRTLDPQNGGLANCILKIGDSSFMISQAREPFVNMQTSFYLFVNDVDSIHLQALGAGGTEVFGPADMTYDDRQSGIQDPEGNYWWISKRLKEKGY